MAETNQQTIQFKDIIKELGLENLTVEKQTELIDRMSETVYKRILLRLVDRLTDEEAKEINHLLDKEDFEKADEYIRDKAPDFVEILKQEVEKFQEQMIEPLKEKSA